VQHDHGSGGKLVAELLDVPDRVTDDAVVGDERANAVAIVDRAADVPDPHVLEPACARVDLCDRDGGAPRGTKGVVDRVEQLADRRGAVVVLEDVNGLGRGHFGVDSVSEAVGDEHARATVVVDYRHRVTGDTLADHRRAHRADRDLGIGGLRVAPDSREDHGPDARRRVQIELIRQPANRAQPGSRRAGSREPVTQRLLVVAEPGPAVDRDNLDRRGIAPLHRSQ
jgi:hypothetical protein